MKVYIDFELNGTGKSKFLSRLIPALKNIGVECRFTPKNCDIGLGIAWKNNPVKGMPYIIRLDGVSFHKEQWRYKETVNKIRKTVKHSNGVIWQSGFCKDILAGMLGVSYDKKQFIIFNGANPKDYEGIEKITCQCSKRIIMSAHWFKKIERPNKRLREMLDIVEQYCNTRDDVIAWIAGETNLISKNKNVVMLGHLPEEELKRYLVSSTVMLYLAYYDWCPNAVVESLVAGTPVICSNSSGVAELVGENGGVVLGLDKKLSITDLYKEARAIDNNIVFDALDRLPITRVCKPNLFIDEIALNYKLAFEEILKK